MLALVTFTNCVHIATMPFGKFNKATVKEIKAAAEDYARFLGLKLGTVGPPQDETARIVANPAMVNRLEESKKQIKAGKGIKLTLDEIVK